MACARRYKKTLDLDEPKQGLAIAKAGNAASTLFVTDLDPAEYLKYQELVADAIPVELQRPSVVVNLGDPNGYPVILVGGMGPISDASILKKLCESDAFLNQFDVTVLSMPPPRSALHANRIFDHFSCLRTHIAAIVNASRYKTASCFMTSNTAHTAFKTFDFALTRGIDARLENVVQGVARQLEAYMDGREGRLILLTTYVTWKSRMYDDLLEGVDLVRVPDSATAKSIQAAVNAGKANKSDMSIIFGYLDGLDLVAGDVVFFGCTDFAFLDDDINSAVRNRYPGVETLDTDAMFPDEIRAIAESRLASSEPKASQGLLGPEDRQDEITNFEAVDELEDYFPKAKDLDAVVADKIGRPEPEPFELRRYGAAAVLAMVIFSMTIL